MITATLIIYWLYHYSLNEDLITVNYKTFYEDQSDHFPDLSLCFSSMFFGKQLEEFGLNVTSYNNFVNGKYFDDYIKNVNIQNISFQMSDYIEKIWIRWKNGSETTVACTNDCTNILTSTFSLFTIGRFYNCYELEIPPYKDIEVYEVLLSQELFKASQYQRPEYEFLTLIHYPNQILLSKKSAKFNWPVRKNNISYEMVFKVTDVEIMEQRNKLGYPCDLNWKHHDQNLVLRHATSIGCMPPYQKTNGQIRTCSTSHEMMISKIQLPGTSESLGYPPCKEMKKVLYTYDDGDLTNTIWEEENVFWIGVAFYDSHFKEIVKTRYKYSAYRIYVYCLLKLKGINSKY